MLKLTNKEFKKVVASCKPFFPLIPDTRPKLNGVWFGSDYATILTGITIHRCFYDEKDYKGDGVFVPLVDIKTLEKQIKGLKDRIVVIPELDEENVIPEIKSIYDNAKRTGFHWLYKEDIKMIRAVLKEMIRDEDTYIDIDMSDKDMSIVGASNGVRLSIGRSCQYPSPTTIRVQPKALLRCLKVVNRVKMSYNTGSKWLSDGLAGQSICFNYPESESLLLRIK